MPELPEVESIAAGLRELIVGKRVERVWMGKPVIMRGPQRGRWRQFLDELAGRRVERVTRRAKRLIVCLEGHSALVFQLGMTGKLLLPRREEGVLSARPKHTRLVGTFSDASELFFVDVRRFGRVWGLNDLNPDDPDAAMEAGGLTHLGPEPLSMSVKTFAGILKGVRPIKALLLDQTRIAGLGNIYVDESLWAAHIHPARLCTSLTTEDAKTLLREIKRVLRRAIAAGGTTFSDFRNAYGDMGRFLNRLRVYQRQGQPCKRCGTVLERIVIAGRGTHICPCCQAKS
ncbi:MAG: bifunctional DNA-formamidopyrimidine glycosylase/DNA-(apurinic or apyrimidinic site) lyase [Sedimentisphaerales bacterium]|nr:bifunctional DNA-formamidopyrimidine glycosylase/DNA-(apurinic or apyrimidinic site) lyase [Sedimentisphaerales bacterium]